MVTRRKRAVDPQERAEALSQAGYMASGNSYISVDERWSDKFGKIPYYSDPAKCDHGYSMCPTWECIESWSLDYQVNLHRTNAGRDLARRLGIDPEKFANHRRVGIEHLDIEDFRISE